MPDGARFYKNCRFEKYNLTEWISDRGGLMRDWSTDLRAYF